MSGMATNTAGDKPTYFKKGDSVRAVTTAADRVAAEFDGYVQIDPTELVPTRPAEGGAKGTDDKPTTKSK